MISEAHLEGEPLSLEKEDEIVGEVSNGRQPLVIGFPGVGKTYLLKKIVQRQKEGEVLWSYHHACNIFMRDKSIAYLLNPILSQLKHQSQVQKKQKIAFVLDQIDVLHHGDLSKYLQDQYKTFNLANKELILVGVTNQPKRMSQEGLAMFSRGVYIPPPSLPARLLILKKFLQNIPNQFSNSDIQEFGELTENFMPSELMLAIRSASYEPIRKIWKAKHFKKVGDKYEACGQEGQPKSYKEIPRDQLLIQAIKKVHVLEQIGKLKPLYSEQDEQQLQSCLSRP